MADGARKEARAEELCGESAESGATHREPVGIEEKQDVQSWQKWEEQNESGSRRADTGDWVFLKHRNLEQTAQAKLEAQRVLEATRNQRGAPCSADGVQSWILVPPKVGQKRDT